MVVIVGENLNLFLWRGEVQRDVDAGDTAATNEQTAPTPSLPNAGITLPTAETTVEAGSPRSQSWQSGFDSLRIFAKHHGHMDVPRKYAKDPSLRGWVQMLSLIHI